MPISGYFATFGQLLEKFGHLFVRKSSNNDLNIFLNDCRGQQRRPFRLLRPRRQRLSHLASKHPD